MGDWTETKKNPLDMSEMSDPIFNFQIIPFNIRQGKQDFFY